MSRKGAGHSQYSYIKHTMINGAAVSQIAIFRKEFPKARIILVDGNAGDGDCINHCDEASSTPHILAKLASQHNALLCLCEHDHDKRCKLQERFPLAMIVASHDLAAQIALSGFHFALWVSDPCGPKGHGICEMSRVATQVRRSDFIIVSNEGVLERFVRAGSSPFWKKHQVYTQQLYPEWWFEQIPKNYLARTQVIPQSPSFHFRLMVIGDIISDGVLRLPNIEVIQRERIARCFRER